MNYYQKNGTLFESKNGGIVPCMITADHYLQLSGSSGYNLSEVPAWKINYKL
jgi:hypothetical protein